ncbi:unnamed protein product [Oncorhynchus mykiss]|uniref:K Homology domain-containing protein n=1 Tax=Oncorhynchus mykiss TaxID=8022 RepID=A0A060XDY4_ONCMY|nr:unnamed protein product [Oncorhynchus mykiss]
MAYKFVIKAHESSHFNFVGKLLGPRGNSLKRLQEDTLTKMSILGKGSMRDKEKEEELRKSGEAKYQHLNEDLHVLIEVFAPPAEAYNRMGHALEEIKKFLIPDYNDEIRQAQLQELTYLNGGSEDAKVPAVRGKLPAARDPTYNSLLVLCGRSRGGVPPPHAAVPRGAAPRGAPPSRVPSARGRGVPAQRTRGAPPRRPPPPVVQDTYGEYVSIYKRCVCVCRSVPYGCFPIKQVRRTGQLIVARRQLHGRPRECTERRPTPDIELIIQQPAQSLMDVSSSNGFYTDAPFFLE